MCFRYRPLRTLNPFFHLASSIIAYMPSSGNTQWDINVNKWNGHMKYYLYLMFSIRMVKFLFRIWLNSHYYIMCVSCVSCVCVGQRIWMLVCSLAICNYIWNLCMILLLIIVIEISWTEKMPIFCPLISIEYFYCKSCFELNRSKLTRQVKKACATIWMKKNE